MDTLTPDLCVIGAGSAGLTLASGAAQMGLRVVLIEAGEMGGDCLNYGCVPSKALIKAAAERHAGAEVTYEGALARASAAIAAIAPHDSQERFEGLGVTVIRARARFLSREEVEAGGQVIRARRFAVATGSSPMVPPIEGLGDVPYFTNETLFAKERLAGAPLPRHLLILGGGPIGMEMAQAHRRLGSEVTVITTGKALAKEEPELATVVTDALRAEGVTIVEGARATRVSKSGEGITLETDGGSYTGSDLLIATGRTPNLASLDLEKAGVEVSNAGITVDDSLRSVTHRGLFAIGDVAGRGQFTHLAGYHGGVALRRIAFGLPSKATAPIPRATFTAPELAHVGLTEAEAREVHGSRLTILTLPFARNDRAQAERDTGGLIKLMVARGRPVGAGIVGPGAGDQIGYWQLALGQKLKLSAIAGMVAPYPTRSEIHKSVAGSYFSPRLFESDLVKRAVGAVQRLLP
ncbi:NAD(P)/FAD-dependent oxidoreductase [Pseudoroseicyclus sp. CXY001]|uniref:dihydrolipoyl dehydrogenase family protein n=1 Tax=Pseudoroseicyclus sp. CXY001 TaxID=3242492 RepID=UPI00357123B9